MMKRSTAFILSSALAGFLLTDCSNNATSPPVSQVDKAVVTADLQLLASKVKSFSAPTGPAHGNSLPKKSALAKTALYSECANGVSTDNEVDSLDLMGSSVYRDTTWYYDVSGNLTCDDTFTQGWQKAHIYNGNPKYESWLDSREDFSVIGAIEKFSMTGTGRVHYFSGYDMTLDKIEITMENGALSKYICNLGLQDDKYQVPLVVANGIDLMGEQTTDPKVLVMKGPILFKTEIVGAFEVMGDDSIIILDADGKVVETH